LSKSHTAGIEQQVLYYLQYLEDDFSRFSVRSFSDLTRQVVQKQRWSDPQRPGGKILVLFLERNASDPSGCVVSPPHYDLVDHDPMLW
jgi:hypothetical protein